MKWPRIIFDPDWPRYRQVLMAVIAAVFLLGQVAAAYLKLCGYTGCG